MTQYCKRSKEDLEVLKNFCDPTGKGIIDHRELMNIIKDPNKIKTLPIRNMKYILNKGIKE